MAVNVVAESGQDGIVGRYVNVAVDDAFYLALDINEVKEPRLGTELEDDTQTGMLDGFIISKGRKEPCFLDIILP